MDIREVRLKVEPMIERVENAEREAAAVEAQAKRDAEEIRKQAQAQAEEKRNAAASQAKREREEALAEADAQCEAMLRETEQTTAKEIEALKEFSSRKREDVIRAIADEIAG